MSLPNPRLEQTLDQLVALINHLLQQDDVLDDRVVSVNPRTDNTLSVYWLKRPTRRQSRRFKRLVRHAMRYLLKANPTINPRELARIAPSYAPRELLKRDATPESAPEPDTDPGPESRQYSL